MLVSINKVLLAKQKKSKYLIFSIQSKNKRNLSPLRPREYIVSVEAFHVRYCPCIIYVPNTVSILMVIVTMNLSLDYEIEMLTLAISLPMMDLSISFLGFRFQEEMTGLRFLNQLATCHGILLQCLLQRAVMA